MPCTAPLLRAPLGPALLHLRPALVCSPQHAPPRHTGPSRERYSSAHLRIALLRASSTPPYSSPPSAPLPSACVARARPFASLRAGATVSQSSDAASRSSPGALLFLPPHLRAVPSSPRLESRSAVAGHHARAHVTTTAPCRSTALSTPSPSRQSTVTNHCRGGAPVPRRRGILRVGTPPFSPPRAPAAGRPLPRLTRAGYRGLVWLLPRPA